MSGQMGANYCAFCTQESSFRDQESIDFNSCFCSFYFFLFILFIDFMNFIHFMKFSVLFCEGTQSKQDMGQAYGRLCRKKAPVGRKKYRLSVHLGFNAFCAFVRSIRVVL